MHDFPHNVPAGAWNTIVSLAKKVGDNILHMMTIMVIVPQTTTLKNPAANPLHALLGVPNALVIKWVYMHIGKLKASKPWPELSKAQAQKQHQLYLPISIVS